MCVHTYPHWCCAARDALGFFFERKLLLVYCDALCHEQCVSVLFDFVSGTQLDSSTLHNAFSATHGEAQFPRVITELIPPFS